MGGGTAAASVAAATAMAAGARELSRVSLFITVYASWPSFLFSQAYDEELGLFFIGF
jgi:hypothetical protein